MELSRYNAKQAARIGLVLSVIFAGLMLAVDTPQSPFFVEWRPAYMMDPLHPIVSIVMAALTGMGLGTLVSLILSNRHRLRAVFRPNVGRIVCGVVFGLLLPFGHISGLPVTMLFPVGVFLADPFGGSTKVLPDPFLWLALTATLTVGYVVASLIISGVRSRWVRIALFGQVWLAAYGAVFMIFGFSVFTL